MANKKTTEQFIIDAKEVHGDKYDYSLVYYKNNYTKIKIICDEHGRFYQNPKSHKNGNGCPTCKGVKKLTTEQFIKQSKKIHNNKYDYSLVNYVNSHTKVKIICKIHGIFRQKPNNHLNGSGCIYCGGTTKLTLEEFTNRSNIIHNNKYDYSLTNYINSTIKVKIICPVHGEFEQKPNDHLNGCGCFKCTESKGEKEIRFLLEKNNVEFEIQKTFDKCKLKNKLRFDFYLPENNLCIEFDGRQHFEINEFFGGKLYLIELQKKDKIKNEYCKENNIDLIRIRYDENINDIINKIYN